MKRLLMVVFVVLTAAACGPCGDSCKDVAEAEVFPELRGPYLGQAPPGAQPQLFAPGIVSTGLATRDVALMPDGDEFYFSVNLGARPAIMVTKQVDGTWTEPAVAPFSGQYYDIEPAISPDGNRFFFLSNRPPDGQEKKPGWGHQDIWVMDRGGDVWGEAYNLGPPVNTDAPEYFPSVTEDGTLYFTREGEGRVSAIYRSRLVDGAYQEAEMLGPEVNCGTNRFNAYVAPDEAFMIVPAVGREDALGPVDYYVVFRSPDDVWSEPVNMGSAINSPQARGWAASLSPDGRYLFFMSSQPVGDVESPITGASLRELVSMSAEPGRGSAGIWWVDASFIESLRP